TIPGLVNNTINCLTAILKNSNSGSGGSSGTTTQSTLAISEGTAKWDWSKCKTIFTYTLECKGIGFQLTQIEKEKSSAEGNLTQSDILSYLQENKILCDDIGNCVFNSVNIDNLKYYLYASKYYKKGSYEVYDRQYFYCLQCAFNNNKYDNKNDWYSKSSGLFGGNNYTSCTTTCSCVNNVDSGDFRKYALEQFGILDDAANTRSVNRGRNWDKQDTRFQGLGTKLEWELS
ncbi:MAG: hypothetical protein IJ848_03155, partial [Alphaproteobacteria bacterium]|nr:hypothetical protein [Alphaproteobacteria bacterium]